MELEQRVESICAALEAQPAPVIVVDGMCGSGKSTLAQALSKRLNAPQIHMDDFFLPFALRTSQRLGETGGNIHYERFEAEVLPFVGKEEGFSYRCFACHDGTFSPACCPAGGLRIVEGSYSLHPRFMKAWQDMQALTVFLSVPEEEQLRRITLRNPELVQQFRSRWIPMENAYFETFEVAKKARLRL